ncbi:hypothetical protein [Prevotella sp. RM4]|uniref:hypothetical protein n=1 Tax=Prevotella sp. RM4 TaxID=1200547 RepID=UPI00051BF3DA|nr:hypothetical protein [Prevotella sp. RM4]
MKKYIIGLIALAGIILMMMYWYKESHQVRIPRYREVKMITWEKLDTFVLSNPTFKVVYPDNFVPDSSLLNNRNMRFDYSFAGCEVFLKCFSYPNDAHMDDSAAVEFSVGLRKIHEDSITMIDKHPGYFYLEGMDRYYKFYEQYVVDKDYIYVLGLFYSPGLGEEKVKNLKALVHEWSPK